ncbi:MAG TPA: hypothetical protein VLM76_09055 [Patescibacteria group bacterium]|nr:hypothetical protein [Patescibacteria group bacterium]
MQVWACQAKGEGEYRVGDEIDLGRFLRIKTAIERVLAGATNASAAQGLRDAYSLWREEARKAMPESLLEEFDRIAPEDAGPRGRMAISPDLPIIAGAMRARLEGLAGWLQGFVEEANQAAQIAANADAYAREKVRSEKPAMGFRTGEQ